MRTARLASADAAPTHVVLTAHGSRDPRSAATIRALSRAVAVARPDVVVHDAYLDFNEPSLGAILADLDGPLIVVPLLLSSAYHAATDIPTIVDVARDRGACVRIAEVLADSRDGGFDLIVAALRRRLQESRLHESRLRDTGGAPDALVLAAAGTRNTSALADIDDIASALGAAEGVPCLAGYAAGAGTPVPDAIDQLRAAGARNVGLASYFLAPGLLFDRISAGRRMVAAPLGDVAEIVAITSRRIDRCLIASEALV